MKGPQSLYRRLFVLVGFLFVVFFLYIIVMYRTQIVQGSEFRAQSMASNATEQTVEASRGVITDRNGKLLVSNRLTYTLLFSADSFTDNDELNHAIWRLLELLQENKVTWTDTLPINLSAPWSLTAEEFDERFVLFAEDRELPGSENETFSLDIVCTFVFVSLQVILQTI